MGLGMNHWVEGDGVVGEVTLDERHEGLAGFAHGGALAALLDDVMGAVPRLNGLWAVTGRLQVRYRLPARLGQQCRVTASLAAIVGSRVEIVGAIDGPQGVIAEADATFVRVEADYMSAG